MESNGQEVVWLGLEAREKTCAMQETRKDSSQGDSGHLPLWEENHSEHLAQRKEYKENHKNINNLF